MAAPFRGASERANIHATKTTLNKTIRYNVNFVASWAFLSLPTFAFYHTCVTFKDMSHTMAIYNPATFN